MNPNENILTIILPNYNSYPFIKTAVSSILDQTFQKFQLIIVDDGSDDKSLEYLKTIDDQRVKLIEREHFGITDSFNFALSFVTTPYCARADADDYYYPEKYEHQIQYLNQNRNILAVGTSGFYMSAKGEVSKLKFKLPSNHEEIINDIFDKKRGMLQPSVVFRTETLKRLNGYRENIYPEDYDLYLRLGAIGELKNIDEPLIAIRIHKSYSKNRLDDLMNKLDRLLLEYADSYMNKFEINKRLNEMILLTNKSIFCYLNNSKIKAVYYLLLSLIRSPIRIIGSIKSLLTSKAK
jgi:glycosyltransferase involved in cell wall biosynthesis